MTIGKRSPSVGAALTGGAATVLVCGAIAAGMVISQPIRAQTTSDSEALNTLEQKWAETVGTLKRYASDHREDALVHARAALEMSEDALATLEARTEREWSDLSAETQERRTAILKDLRARRDDLHHWYRDMEQASEKSWDQVRDGFADAYGRLSAAIGEAIDGFYTD